MICGCSVLHLYWLRELASKNTFFMGNENFAMQYQKVQKSSWNEPYSSSPSQLVRKLATEFRKENATCCIN